MLQQPLGPWSSEKPLKRAVTLAPLLRHSGFFSDHSGNHITALGHKLARPFTCNPARNGQPRFVCLSVWVCVFCVLSLHGGKG